MTLEGLLEFEAVRDYLYARMRGARDHGHAVQQHQGAAVTPVVSDELASVLREVAAELRALRLALGRRDGGRTDA